MKEGERESVTSCERSYNFILLIQELLVDLLYYYEDGEVFCARDYADKAKMPRCGACDELIFAAEYTGAENNVFHLKHFCCYECDQPLAGHKYVPMNGQPHCLHCYQAKHGKVRQSLSSSALCTSRFFQYCHLLKKVRFRYSHFFFRPARLAGNTSRHKIRGSPWTTTTGTPKKLASAAGFVRNRSWDRR